MVSVAGETGFSLALLKTPKAGFIASRPNPQALLFSFLGYHACNVHVQVDNAAVNFLVDHLSLRMLANDPQWKTKANERIENIRKANVTFR